MLCDTGNNRSDSDPAPLDHTGGRRRTGGGVSGTTFGVGTTGTIARKLFGGWIDEQALAVHVAGKGIVLIVGCGHQTILRLLERAEAMFGAPPSGVIGALARMRGAARPAIGRAQAPRRRH